MRIKRLDITGFKSFMERSVFTFDDGITGVVGPNGCGKSNVVDAIRWVMGEQSAKNLRGRGMEDVIFNGSESKSPLSMAEVSLTFRVEPQDTLAPQYVGFPEITVTRRLFRSGDSEYLINKTQCRLLDITELFLGTGVGTRAYSIIEQGRVGLIVSAKPEDRRSLIEEAAGVTKYKSRRKAAERKMEHTQQNLLRITDLVTELQRRLESLNRQAKKAEKYRKLKEEMRELELHSAALRYLSLMAELKLSESRLAELSAEERANVEQLRDLEMRVQAGRAALEEQARHIGALSEKVFGLDGEIRLDEQTLQHAQRDAEANRRRMEEARVERSALEQRRVELISQIEARDKELQELLLREKEDEVATQVAQEELRRATSLQSELSLAVEQERTALVALASRVANGEANLQNMERTRADLDARRDKILNELSGLAEQEASMDQARAEVEGRVHQSRQNAQELAERRGHEEEALVRTRQAFAESEVQVISLREELADKRSRYTSLLEIQRSYEGFDRGVRAVMKGAGEEARSQGIFGLVADVLSTSPTYEKAIEAALGEQLQYVVVENREKGLSLLAQLKAASEGRSTFLPVEWPQPAGDLPEAAPGFLARASDEIRSEESLQPLLKALLSNVLIVSDLEAAKEYARGGSGPYTLVTLEGEVLRPDGSVTGGALEGAAAGALQKKREIAELGEEVKRVEDTYSEVVTRHYMLQKQMGQVEGVLKGLSKNQHAEELTLASSEKDLHQAGAELSRLRDRKLELERDEAQLAGQLLSLQIEEETARGEVAHGAAEQRAREEKLRQMGTELEGAKEMTERHSSELTGIRIKLAALNERKEAARKEMEQLQLAATETEARVAKLAASIEDGEVAAKQLVEQIETCTAHRDLCVAERAELSGQLDAKRQTHEEEIQKVHQEDAALRERRSRMDELTHSLSELSLKGRELELERGHLVDAVRDRWQSELELELHRFHMLSIPEEGEVRLKELRGQVKRMGEINLTAIEECKEVSERFDFLDRQKGDLERSLEQLKEAIAKIDRTSRERFGQTFEVINEKFQQVFPRLFGGGRAGLVLTEEGPSGEQGVEIVAQPPGKKLQSVTLLSGGEKALTAVSLIFAIFLIKPTPFCLLDEVDAPLDEGNVGRYNDMVREMSGQSQFILITHNKRTMEVADTLYGVTMEEPGISKLVSVHMKAAVAAANDDRAA
jgi:chromosome segregation protein